MEQDSFGNWLKRRRKALDLTQAELGDQVGCSAAAIRKIEAEERRPSREIVERLGQIFKIPFTEQASFLRFARGELRFSPAKTEANFPWQVSTTSTHSNLPLTVTSLIGREREIALVREYLSSPNIRLVSLVGPPGIGKTRLSIEAARAVLADFPDGVFFVALAPLDDPSLLVPSVSQVLGYVETRNTSAVQQLVDGIANKQMLLVLDNCEHLIEAIASLVSNLLLACPRLKILVTSRESLRVPGEWLYSIPSLNVPKENFAVDIEAVSEFPSLVLFAERARAVRADFSLNADNIETVTAICARLDGLPLVIELIAARMRLMTPQALLTRLTNQFVLTADGMRAASERQTTLYSAIDWSYRLLLPEEQKLFAYLSVYSGGFSLEIVEGMFSRKINDTSLPKLITSLLDKSLLKIAPDDESSWEPRYIMLETIREFAKERLQDMGEGPDVRREHLAYFLDLANRADQQLRGHNQLEWLNRLVNSRDNLRTALDWAIETGLTETALQMACYLTWFWFRRSDLSEGRQWLGRVVELPDASQFPKLYSYALAQLALHAWLQSGPKQARPFVEKALSIAHGYDDTWNMAWALTVLGLVLIHEGDFAGAQSTMEKSKELYREVHDEWGDANAIICLALGTFIQGDLATSLAQHEEALAAFRKLEDKYFECVALRFIGLIEVKQGNLKRGVTILREALILAQQINTKYEIGATLSHFGDAALAEGNFMLAVRFHWAARTILDSIGVWRQDDEAELENNLAACLTGLGETEFTQAVEHSRAMTTEQAIAYALEVQE